MTEPMPHAPATGFRPGAEVGGYRIGARLGSGAMGSVYSAHDGGGNLVAIKFLHAHLDTDAEGRQRLYREASALQRLRHPAVAQILDVELDGPEAFIVTELISGPTLEAEIAARGPLDPWDLLELADQLAAALEAVHGAGVIHRDLKPSNVLIADQGPVLIDFGIAQGLDESRYTATGIVMGTPGYLAPELLDNAPLGPGTDWWGWAAVVAFAATGRRPFGMGPMEAVIGRALAGTADLAGLGPTTTAALAGALRPDPAQRSTPTEVITALRYAADSGDLANATETVAVEPPTEVVPAEGPESAPVLIPPVVVPPVLPVGQPVHDGRTVAVSAADVRDAEGLPPSIAPGGTAEGDSDDPEQATDDESPEPGYQRPEVPERRWIVGLSVVAAAALAGFFPGVVLGVVVLVIVVMRMVGETTEAIHRRREQRGVSNRDRVRAVFASPWYFLRAVVGAVPSMTVAAAGAGLVVAAGWALFADGAPGARGFASQESPGWLLSVVLCVAGLIAGVLAWAGPWTAKTRYGARTTLAHVAGSRSGTLLVVAGLLVAIVVAGILVAVGYDVFWWPFRQLSGFN